MLSQKTRKEIEEVLKATVLAKLKTYKPETSYMPFHYNLLGKDRYAMFSFIQSMNTTFGMSIWEQVAVILAKGAGNAAERQFNLVGEVDRETEKLIQKMHYELRKANASADIAKQTEDIRKRIKKGRANDNDPDSVVDVFVNTGRTENYFDITTVKPNMKEFVSMKLKLLRWTALRLSQDKKAKVFARLAIPYNPYHPQPYDRWTLKGLFDLKNGEVLVGREFWNFVANDDVYEEILDIFQIVGESLRKEIDKKFQEFKNLKTN